MFIRTFFRVLASSLACTLKIMNPFPHISSYYHIILLKELQAERKLQAKLDHGRNLSCHRNGDIIRGTIATGRGAVRGGAGRGREG